MPIETARLALILDHLPGMICHFDAEGRLAYCNRRYARWFNADCTELIGRHMREITGAAFALVEPYFRRAMQGHTVGYERAHVAADGSVRYLEVAAVPHKDERSSGVTGVTALLTDVTGRKEAELALADSETRFRALTELSSDWYWEYTEDGRFTSFNGEGSDLTAVQALSALLQGRPIPPDVAAGGWDDHRRRIDDRLAFHEVLLEHRMPDGSMRHSMASGVPVVDQNGVYRGYRGVGKDVTDRALAEQRIVQMAYFDALTGLPNRSLIQDRIAEAVERAGREDRRLAVLFLDLDNFKNINDSLGHDVGDMLLARIAERLRAAVGGHGSIGRLGGDEFVVVAEVADAEAAALLGTDLVKVFAAPVHVGPHELRVAGSIGVSLFPQHGRDAPTLMRHADLAMYEAKAAHRSEVRFFTDELNRRIQRRFALENDLRRAIEAQELQLHYQPRVEFAGGRIVGLEALVRWNRPGEPQIAPGEFIPIAEEIGLIGPLGDWVLREACRQAAQWAREGYEVPPISVNVSVSQLHRPDFARSVERILTETGLNPRLLELEITENLMFELTQDTHAALDTIDRMGIGLAVDDFGSGYSSLSSLKRVPINVLKIDQAFVRDIVDDPSDAALVSAILAIAKSLGLRAVAEGVESADHLQALQDLGCRYGQGYFFSEPLPAEACLQFLGKPARAA